MTECGTVSMNTPGHSNNLGYIKLTETILFYILIILAVFFVYKLPQAAFLFFAILLAWATLSRKGYFWIAFFFLLVQAPGHLFKFTPDIHLPSINILPDISLGPVDLFTLLMFAKCLILRKRCYLNLKAPLILLFMYFTFSFFRGAMFYSSSLDTPITLLRQLFYYVWIFIFIALVENKTNVIKFIRLLLPITFFILFTQLYYLSTRTEFIATLNPDAGRALINELTGEVRPVAGGFLLIFLSFIGASLVLKYKKGLREGKFLVLVMIASCLSVFLSATRIIFVLFLVVGAGIYFRKLKDLSKLFMFCILTALIILLLIKFGVFSVEYLQYSAWGRIAEIFKFIGGEGAAITTYDSRLGMLETTWRYFIREPIFGYGFSEFMIDHWLGHWGFYCTLYELGICGLGFFIIIFVKYFRMLIAKIRLTEDRPLRESLEVLLMAFIGMLVLYGSTWNFFSPIHADRILFLMVFFGISEIFVGYPLAQKGGGRIGQ